MMPNDCGRAECNDVTCLLQPPAKINVVPGFAVLTVEPADGVEGPTIKGHVAAWNVLRDGVGEQDVTRSPGSSGDTGLHPVFRRRRNVRPADARIIPAHP